jgi:hypothetical protein
MKYFQILEDVASLRSDPYLMLDPTPARSGSKSTRSTSANSQYYGTCTFSAYFLHGFTVQVQYMLVKLFLN